MYNEITIVQEYINIHLITATETSTAAGFW